MTVMMIRAIQGVTLGYAMRVNRLRLVFKVRPPREASTSYNPNNNRRQKLGQPQGVK